MARRMRRRLGLLLVAAALPLALWAVLPAALGAARRLARSRTRSTASRAQIEQHKGRERVLTTRHHGRDAPDRHAAGRHHELCSASRSARDATSRPSAPSSPRIQARAAPRARSGSRGCAPGSPAPRVLLAAAPRRDLQGRPARHRHRRARSPTASPTCSSAPSSCSASSEQDAQIIDARARAPRPRRPRPPQRLDKLEQRRPQEIAKQIEGQVAPGRRRQGQPDRPPRPLPVARADKASMLRARRGTAARARGGRRRAAEGAVGDPRAALAGSSGAPPPGRSSTGSGGLIWPVNGPITSAFCESRSWEACHPGIDIARPGRHADPRRRRRARRRDRRLGRRLRQLHLHPARRRVSTCYGHQSRFGVLGRRSRSARARSSASSAAPATASAPTCTSRCASTASVVNPMNYLVTRLASGTSRHAARDSHIGSGSRCRRSGSASRLRLPGLRAGSSRGA